MLAYVTLSSNFWWLYPGTHIFSEIFMESMLEVPYEWQKPRFIAVAFILVVCGTHDSQQIWKLK